MPTVLLTGATGFLGFRTLEKLVQQPNIGNIIAVGRTLKPTHTLVHPKVKYQLGDLKDNEFVKTVFANVDWVINAASLSSPWGRREEFVESNIDTQRLLILAAKHTSVKRFIYISSPSIYYNGRDRHMVRESDDLPSRFVNEYARTKYEAELLLQQSGLPFIILRPRALIGRGDTIIMPRLIRSFDEGRLRIMGSGENSVDLTSVENVANAIICSLNAGEQHLQQSYNITNGEPIKLWPAIQHVLKLLGKELPEKRIPASILHAYAKLSELKSRLTDYTEPTLTVYGVGTLTKTFTLDISKATKNLGYVPGISTEQSIQEFAQWYKTYERS